MEKRIFQGNWSSYKDMVEEHWETRPAYFPPESAILYASYDTPDYVGYCTIYFERDESLYEVTSSHCSCNGLEWEEAKINWEYLMNIYPIEQAPNELIKNRMLAILGGS